jgi:hypothetical protein
MIRVFRSAYRQFSITKEISEGHIEFPAAHIEFSAALIEF